MARIKINISKSEATVEQHDLATEHTLRDLLNAVSGKGQAGKTRAEEQKTTKDLLSKIKDLTQSYKKKGNEEATASTLYNISTKKLNSEFGSAADAIVDNVASLGVFKSSLLKFGGPLALLGGSVVGAINAVGGMVYAFFKGSNSLSDYTDAITEGLSKIPFIGGLLGMFGSVITMTIQYFEDLNAELYNLSSNGASFNNNLMEMRNAAARTGLTLDQFSNIISNNTDAVAQFGGTMTEGANNFSLMSAQIRKRFGSELMGMGYNLQQTNEALLDYIDLNRTGMALQSATNTDMQDAARNLMVEFDGLAKLTGQSRKQQADVVKKQQATAAFQMMKARLGADERAKVDAAQAKATALFGEAAGEAITQIMLGMPPLTQQTKMLAATQPELYRQLQSMVANAKNTNMSFEQFSESAKENAIAAAKDMMKQSKGMEQVLAAAAAGLGGNANDIANVYSQLLQNTSKFMNRDNTLNEKAFRQALDDVAKEQKKRDGVKAALDRFTLAMVNIRERLFTSVIQPLYMKIQPFIEKLANWFESQGDSLSNGLDWLAKSLGDAAEYIAQNLFSEEGRAALKMQIVGFFQELLVDIKEQTIGQTWFGKSAEGYEEERKKIRARTAAYDKPAEVKRLESQLKATQAELEKYNETLGKEEEQKRLTEKHNELQKKLDEKNLELSKAVSDIKRDQLAAEKKKLEIELKDNDDLLFGGKRLEAARQKILDKQLELGKPESGEAYDARVSPKTKQYNVPQRWQNEMGDENALPVRETGSLGEVGKLIEDFGKGTNVVLHGKEGVITEDQLYDLLSFTKDQGKIDSQVELQKMLLGLPKQFASDFEMPMGDLKVFDDKVFAQIKSLTDSFKKPLDSARSMIDSLTTSVKEVAAPSTQTEGLEKVIASIQTMFKTPTNVQPNREQEAILATLKQMLDEMKTSNRINEEIKNYVM